MVRKRNKQETIRQLFAKSGNQCAFPDCSHELINVKGQFIAQICHIEAAEKGGERYNPNSNDEKRRSYDNLLLLCYAHHIETNEFTVTRMKKIKRDHEKKYLSFHMEEQLLKKIEQDISKYWNEITILNTRKHLEPDLAIKLNYSASFSDLIFEITEIISKLNMNQIYLAQSDGQLADEISLFLSKKGISDIFEDIPYHENPFSQRNWEIHNLTIPNFLSILEISIAHLEVKFWEESIKHASDQKVKINFQQAKDKLTHLAETATHHD